MLVAFGIGCLIRSVPLAISFPYPIGYDTVNYYLPNLYHFESNWLKLVTEFPIYIATVYIFSFIFSFDVYYSFLASNVILYGVFSMTIYLLSNKVLNQSLKMSLAFTVFAIFQFGTLRISWDLFRDLFSLILLNLFLLLVNHLNKENAWNRFISVLTVFSISVLTIFSDRMIGMLLISVSFIFSIMYKQKYLFMINAFFASSFLFYFLAFDRVTFVSANVNFVDMLLNPLYDRNTFSNIDISILFLSLYGPLIPFFAYGFVYTKLKDSFLIIKIPLLISLLLSFNWIFIPNYGYLVPERWLLISGIYMSLISIYGFLLIVDSSLGLKNKSTRKGVIFLFLLVFVVYGSLFTVMPYGVTYSLPSFFHENTEFVFPLSMLFNTLDIKDNPEMIKLIDWINSNTAHDSTVIGTHHWKGWFSLFLDPPRKYLYAEDFNNPGDNSYNGKARLNYSDILEKNLALYLCPNIDNGADSHSHSSPRHINTSHYFIDYNNDVYADNPFFQHIDYNSKFSVYNLTSYACSS